MIKVSINTMQEPATYALGAAAATNWVWIDWLAPSYQPLVAVLGLVIIVLTIINKWFEIRIKRQVLKDRE